MADAAVVEIFVERKMDFTRPQFEVSLLSTHVHCMPHRLSSPIFTVYALTEEDSLSTVSQNVHYI